MSALDDRRQWLDHLDDCTLCPTYPCDKGEELMAAVREGLAPGERWAGIWRPHPGHPAGRKRQP